VALVCGIDLVLLLERLYGTNLEDCNFVGAPLQV